MEEVLEKKLALLKQSRTLKNYDRLSITKECRRLEKELGIAHVQPREVIFLKMLADKAKLGAELDLKELAKLAGYNKTSQSAPVAHIIKQIDQKLFSAIVGFSRADIEYELTKMIRQDEDLTGKMRALELASKITGLTTDNPSVAIQINSGIKLAD